MIKVYDNYYINADSNCYTLNEYVGKNKKDEDTYKTLGYYTTIEDCFRGINKKEIRNYIAKNDIDIKELIEELKRLENKIDELNLKI